MYAGGAGGGGEGGEGGEINTARFKPDKGFTGADYGQGEGGPVQVRGRMRPGWGATGTCTLGVASCGAAMQRSGAVHGVCRCAGPTTAPVPVPLTLPPPPHAPPPSCPQVEKEGDEADPFGLDAFLSDVRAGKKKGALDDIGKGGGMRAGGGGSSYDQHEGGSGRRRDFVSGGGR